MKPSTSFIPTLLVLCLPFAAHACDYYPNGRTNVSFPATITVPSTLPVGGLIASQVFTGTYPSGVSTCNAPVSQVETGRYTDADVVTVPGVSGRVHRTNVPGVGIQIVATLLSGTTYHLNMRSQAATLPAAQYRHDIRTMQARFYKIGPVANGTYASGNLHENRWYGNNIHTAVLNTAVRFVAPSATCDLAAGDVNRAITLNNVRVSDFTNANSAGARDFELTANCSDASSVTFAFSGTPAPGSSYRFANTGTAKGIGLQLYSRIGGVAQTIRADGTDSRRTVAVSGNRAVLPLGASYWKIGTVSKGTLASTATVTISYN